MTNMENEIELKTFLGGETILELEYGNIKLKDIVQNKSNACILCFNNSRKKLELKRVVDWHEKEVSNIFCIEAGGNLDKIFITGDYPVFCLSRNGYCNAKDLIVGDILMSMNGNGVFIKDIKIIDGRRFVYNIEVADSDNYIANGILVNNCRTRLIER